MLQMKLKWQQEIQKLENIQIWEKKLNYFTKKMIFFTKNWIFSYKIELFHKKMDYFPKKSTKMTENDSTFSSIKWMIKHENETQIDVKIN